MSSVRIDFGASLTKPTEDQHVADPLKDAKRDLQTNRAGIRRPFVVDREVLPKLRLQLVALPAVQWLAVSPEGHYRSVGGTSRDLRFVVETDKGQETLTEEQFADKYGWKNNPDKVRLLPE